MCLLCSAEEKCGGRKVAPLRVDVVVRRLSFIILFLSLSISFWGERTVVAERRRGSAAYAVRAKRYKRHGYKCLFPLIFCSGLYNLLSFTLYNMVAFVCIVSFCF